MNPTEIERLRVGLKDPQLVITQEMENDFNERVKEILGQ